MPLFWYLSTTAGLGCPKRLRLPTEITAYLGWTLLMNSSVDDVFEPWWGTLSRSACISVFARQSCLSVSCSMSPAKTKDTDLYFKSSTMESSLPDEEFSPPRGGHNTWTSTPSIVSLSPCDREATRTCSCLARR